MRSFLAAILIFIFFLPQSVSAAKGSLQIAPSLTEVVLGENDAEKTIEFNIKNNSEEEISLEIFPVKFHPVGDYGRIGFEGLGTYDFPLVSYFVPRESTIELSPGEKRKIQAVIYNRSDLTPGGHYVALVSRLISKDTENRGSSFNPALSSLVLIRKTGGERFNLSLKDTNFPRGSVEFFYPEKMTLLFQNEGNIHVVPYGRIEIKDMFGRLTHKGIINTGSLNVLPSSRRYLTVDLQKLRFVYPLSVNSVEVTGRDSLNKIRFVFKETYVYINPLLILLFPAGFVIARRIKRKSRHNT